MRRLLCDTGVVLAFALSFTGVGACSTLTGERPVLPDSVFVSVLTELHLAEVRVELGYPVADGIADSIFGRYAVTRSDFEETIEYYLDHTDEYIQRYNEVIEGLNEDRAQF